MDRRQLELVQACAFVLYEPPSDLCGLREGFVSALCHVRYSRQSQALAAALQCAETDDERALVHALIAEKSL